MRVLYKLVAFVGGAASAWSSRSSLDAYLMLPLSAYVSPGGSDGSSKTPLCTIRTGSRTRILFFVLYPFISSHSLSVQSLRCFLYARGDFHQVGVLPGVAMQRSRSRRRAEGAEAAAEAAQTAATGPGAGTGTGAAAIAA